MVDRLLAQRYVPKMMPYELMFQRVKSVRDIRGIAAMHASPIYKLRSTVDTRAGGLSVLDHPCCDSKAMQSRGTVGVVTTDTQAFPFPRHITRSLMLASPNHDPPNLIFRT
jgi:hypothetical protein